MSALDRKLGRDLWHLRGQIFAVALVVASGIALFVTLRSMHIHLMETQARYYDEYRFADVFVQVRRAPLTVVRAISAIPGVAAAEGRIVSDVTLDVPGLGEPAVGRLVSIPEDRQPALNALHLRRGRWVEPGRQGEALASEAFSRANGLNVGDSVGAVIHGRWQRLTIVGIALSPEYVYEIRGGGEIFPDNRRFGVIWMGRGALEAAFDMEGAFNDLSLTLLPGASEPDVIARVDRLLGRHGGLGAYGRSDHVSDQFISSEITETQVTSVAIPAIFLGVTAFLLHIVLSRLVSTQRDQIAVLKAFGYSDAAVGGHYLKLSLAPVAAGSLAGAALGLWFAMKLAAIYARFYQFPVLRYRPSPGIAALAVLIGGGAALAGALSAVHRAVSLPPAEAMRPEGPTRYRPGLARRLGLERLLPLSARIVLRNLERQPLKALLSTLGLALAVAIVVTGFYAFDAVDWMRNVQFGRIQREDVTVVFRDPGESAACHELARLPGVLRVEPFRSAAVRLRHGPRAERTAILAMDRNAELRQIVDAGLRTHELPLEGLLLTSMLAAKLGVRPGDSLTVEVLEGRRPVREVEVAGLVDEMVGTAVYMERGELGRLLGEGPAVSGAWLAVDPAASATLYARLKRLPAVSGVAVKQVMLEGFDKTVAESFRLSLMTVIGFACVIAFGVVYNGARIGLSERGRELASLRILGFSRREVATMLLGEQTLLTLLSLPLGFAIGYGLCALMAWRFESELFRLPLVISSTTWLLAVGVVGAAAVLSGLAVRYRLDRMDLVSVLKTRE